jgi:hypothetical protein
MAHVRERPVAIVLRVLIAAALGVSAYVHADLAPQFDGNGGDLSQGNLFRIEAGVASLAALLILVVASRLVSAFALVVAVGALAAVLVTRYVDISAFGPFPDMYDPAWYTEKTVSAIAEALAVVTSAALLLTRLRSART